MRTHASIPISPHVFKMAVWNPVSLSALMGNGSRASYREGCRALTNNKENIMNIHADQRSGASSEFKAGATRTMGTGSEAPADLDALRADFNALKDTVTNYISKTSD